MERGQEPGPTNQEWPLATYAVCIPGFDQAKTSRQGRLFSLSVGTPSLTFCLSRLDQLATHADLLLNQASNQRKRDGEAAENF